VNYQGKCSRAARTGWPTWKGPFTNTVRTPSLQGLFGEKEPETGPALRLWPHTLQGQSYYQFSISFWQTTTQQNAPPHPQCTREEAQRESKHREKEWIPKRDCIPMQAETGRDNAKSGCERA